MSSNILQDPITMNNALPYSLALTDKEIANAQYTLYKLKQAKNILPTPPTTTYPPTPPTTTYPPTPPTTTYPQTTAPSTTYPQTTTYSPTTTYPQTTTYSPTTTYHQTTTYSPTTTYHQTTAPSTTYPQTTAPSTTYPQTTAPLARFANIENFNNHINKSQNTFQNTFQNTNQSTSRSNFDNIPAPQMPPLLNSNSANDFLLSESTSPDINTYIQPFNSSVGLMDDPLNMQKYAFNMYLSLQNDKLNTLNTQLTSLEKQNKQFKTANSSYPIKSVKNTASALSLNVDEYTSRGISTSNYNASASLKPASSTFINGTNTCTPINNSENNYYLLYANNRCLSYDDPNSEYAFQPCNANDPMQQFYINPVNTQCDYNHFACTKIGSASSVKMGFNVITPRTNSGKCVTTYPDNRVTVEPCTLTGSNNQKFQTFYKNIL